MIQIGKLKGFSVKEVEKFLSARILANMVMATGEFYLAVLASEFTSTSKSSSQVYENIRIDCAPNFTIRNPTLWERLFRTKAKEGVGWEITFIRTHFTKMTIEEVAGTIAHEVCHGLGFVHKDSDEMTSVPYQIGNIVTDQAKKMMTGNRSSGKWEVIEVVKA